MIFYSSCLKIVLAQKNYRPIFVKVGLQYGQFVFITRNNNLYP
jgi:hypothetical protein